MIEIEMYYIWIMKIAFLFLCIGFTVGVVMVFFCGRKVYETKIQNRQVPTRSVKVQSQTTYKYKYTSPRYKELGEKDHGGWSD